MKIEMAINQLSNGNIKILDELNKKEISVVLNIIKQNAIEESFEKLKSFQKINNQKN